MRNFRLFITAFLLTLFTPLNALEWKEKIFNLPPQAAIGEKHEIQFAFTNNTQRPVKILETRGACDCTKIHPFMKTIFAPGESGILRATFDTKGMSGTIERLISVRTDEPGGNAYTLVVRGNFPESITVTPRALFWERNSVPKSQVIDIEINLPSGLELIGVTSQNKQFSTQLAPVEPRRRYRLTVTPGSTNQPQFATLLLAASPNSNTQGINLTIFARIR